MENNGGVPKSISEETKERSRFGDDNYAPIEHWLIGSTPKLPETSPYAVQDKKDIILSLLEEAQTTPEKRDEIIKMLLTPQGILNNTKDVQKIIEERLEERGAQRGRGTLACLNEAQIQLGMFGQEPVLVPSDINEDNTIVPEWDIHFVKSSTEITERMQKRIETLTVGTGGPEKIKEIIDLQKDKEGDESTLFQPSRFRRYLSLERRQTPDGGDTYFHLKFNYDLRSFCHPEAESRRI